jgi:spore coat protein U-like protein
LLWCPLSRYLKCSFECLRTWCVASVCVLVSQAAEAAETSTFTVSAQFSRSCTVSATPLSFGASIPTPIAAPVYSTATITALCSETVLYSVALGAGNGPSATPALRQMTAGSNVLAYRIFEDAARTRVWGDGTGGTMVSTLTGTGALQTLDAFGSISEGQAPAVGFYTDTVTVAVVF